MVIKCSDKAVSSSGTSQSEEISTSPRVGESISVPTKLCDDKPKKTLDLKYITNLDDLKSIQKQDPFMYYSIPEVRTAKMLMRDIDVTDLGVSGQAVQDGQEEAPRVSQKVSRSSRISFECHPDLLFENMWNDIDDDLHLVEDEEDLLDMEI